MRVGWIGLGRMCLPMATRLLDGGYSLSIWNRTKSKAEPLGKRGANIVNELADLAGVDVLFTMVATGGDVKEVCVGPILVDCSSIGIDESNELRHELQCVGYPIAGTQNDPRQGQRRYNVVWYRPADEKNELPLLLTDRDGVTHSISIPPPLVRSEPIAAMRMAAEWLLAPQFCEIVRLIEQPFLQPIYDLESPRLAFGRVAIIGDAAFVARPHVAAGVSKAADDAAALAEALDAEDVEVALRRFEAQRLPR